MIGRIFQDAQVMKVISRHEKFEDTWWCEGVQEAVGLWAYSGQFILNHPVLP